MQSETNEVETQAVTVSEDQKGDEMTATATAAPPKKETVKTKAAAPPAAKTKPIAYKFLGSLVAQQKAARENESVEVGFEYFVPLRRIVGSDNPRKVPTNLARLGYKLVDVEDQEHSLIHMATSADMEVVQQCVSLFEEHENDPDGHVDDDRDVVIGSDNPKSIVSLAHQFALTGQLQAVVVRPIGKGDNRTLIFGQRRVAATIYLHAKSRVEVADGVEGAKVYPATVRAVERKVSADEAWDMAAAENLHREDFSAMEEAAVYHRDLERINPETNKKYTLREVARKHGAHVGRVRSYAALLKPRNEKTGKGLTDEDRRDIEEGKKTVTWGIRRALNEKHYNATGERQENRAKPIPLKAMHKLFDDTAESKKERREAIAECMGLTLEEAVKQSEERIAEAEQKETKKRRKGAANTEGDGEQEEVESEE